MKFKSSTIQPEGRLSYGHYMAAGNITNSVVKTTYYGNDTTTTIGDNDNNGGNQDDKTGFYMFISKESETFDAQGITLSGATDSIQVIGYKGNERVPTYVTDLDGCEVQYDEVTNEATGLTIPVNFGISGVPSSGMSVTISGNGSLETTINLAINSAITGSAGSLLLPCYIYLSTGSEMGNDPILWYNRLDQCERINFEYNWKIVNGQAGSAYRLDLSNEIAGVNCDSDGYILPGAIMPTCRATLYYGTDPVTGATYGLYINPSYHCYGVSINTQTGELTFGSNFAFDGSTLQIDVTATVAGTMQGRKSMTVMKNLPGANGESPVTRWLVLSAGQIVYDPNNQRTTPQSIICQCWKQSGNDTPEEDYDAIIYWKYESDNYWISSETQDPRNGISSFDVTESAILFALMTTNGDIYESESVPILKNGADGQGSSPYRLDLDNQNASINCDAEGNILGGAIRPECTATLYYGETAVLGAQYELNIPAMYKCSGVTINSQTGVIHFNSGNESPALYWSGTTLQIPVVAYEGNVIRGRATMNVSKNLPGADGDSAVAYWLSPSSNAIHVDSAGTASPSTISCSAWKQVGEETPVQLASSETPYIYYGYNTDDPGTHYNGATLTVDTAKTYLCFQLWARGTQYDIETIPILRDGENGVGEQGRQGAAIRGPIDWYSGITANRRFCNGVGPLETDKDFIDILLKDGTYYRCTTSYDGYPGQSWNSVSANWTASDASYNFVATELLLAQNAKINFLSGNELYLFDPSTGKITAGAAGSSGITFWAGSDKPSEGLYRVYADGSMVATKGTFGCLTIGEDNYGNAGLFGHTGNGDDFDFEMTMSPEIISLVGVYDSGGSNETREEIALCPNRNGDTTGELYNAALNIITDGNSADTIDILAIETNETIRAAKFSQRTTRANVGARAMPTFGGVVSTPGLFSLEVCFQTSTETWSSYFTKDGYHNTWRFMGLDTGVSYLTWPYVGVQNTATGADSEGLLGFWAFYITSSGGRNWTAIGGPNITKKAGVIYIQI